MNQLTLLQELKRSVAKIPRDYQQDCVEANFDYFVEHDGSPINVIPTAGGKSLIIAELIRQANLYFPGTRFIILSHVSLLLTQNAEELMGQWPEAHITFFSDSLGQKELDGDIVFAGIQSIYKRAYDFRHSPDLIIIDECHLLSPNDSSMYRKFLDDIKVINPQIKIIGFTATPYRAGQGMLHKGKNALFTHIAYEIGITELISRGHLCPIVTPQMNAKMDTSGVKMQGGDFIASQLSKAVDRDDVTKACIDEVIAHGEDRKKWIVFTVDIKHCEHVRDEIRSRGISCDMVHSKMDDSDCNRVIEKYKKDEIRCLVNVAKMTTGANFPAIDMMVFMRPLRSPVLYVQCLDEKTEILTSHGWKKKGEIKKGDVCASMDLKTGKGKWSRVRGVVERDMEEGESWISYKAPHLDFRVTDNHTMIVGLKGGDFKKMPAIDLYKRGNCSYIPTCVKMDNTGVPLNDDELYLIGIIMTDGTVSGHQIGISQSERYPYVIKKIEDTLNNLKIDFGKARFKAKPGDGSFIERHPRWVFSISAGKPRRGHNSSVHRFKNEKFTGTGLRHLMPYLDKDFPSLLNQMSRSQFEVWLKGINDGDGTKHKDADYKVRTISICSARKKFIDRVQALAVTLGYSCNFATEQGNRKNPIYYLHFKDVMRRSIAGQTIQPSVTRPTIKKNDFTKERVWCVETEHGIIITRRNGKVAVVGNCAGRGMRTFPGKSDCKLLDFGGTVAALGPIDQIRVPEKKGGEGEAPIKYCPGEFPSGDKCNATLHAAAMKCPHCGYDFPEHELHLDGKPSDAAVLSSQLKPKVAEVSRVMYYRHKKEGKPDTLRIDYLCGFETYREWCHFEHGSYPREKACAWWKRRADTKPPNTITEALERSKELRIPSHIHIKKIGKYHEITAADFDSITD